MNITLLTKDEKFDIFTTLNLKFSWMFSGKKSKI